MMKVALFEYLNADPVLDPLIGDRIYPIKAPQSADFPRLVYTRISNPREVHMLGESGLSRAIYQIDSWALDDRTVEAVALAVRLALSGFIRKFMGTSAPVAVDSIFCVDEDDTVEKTVDGSDTSAFRIRQDYTINHREPIAAP